MSRPTVIGGKLKLKGIGPSSKTVSKKRKAEDVEEVVLKESLVETTTSSVDPESLLTASERRFLEKKRELEVRTIKTMSGKTFRERVEDFNARLSSTTEHNEIPRVSAAGNG